MNSLDNYEILSIIGEGTFGVVRLGKVKLTGEKVAIKILEKKKMISQDDKERVEREIEILNKINHINVIKIIKIIKDPDKIYIIMEFCENGELFNYIVKKQNLDEEEAAYYYYQLINGLECLHHYGIVHRDLKPENLLLSKNNILKIIDFGLSNYFNKMDLLSTPCGSPSYASPEMVSGNKYDGFLIDIWSSGIILYAMICGFLPFEDQDNEILFKKIYECKVEFPNDIDISKDAIDLMKKIMVSNPKKRITLNQIKNHGFYLKGKEKFKQLHPKLVKEVEKTYEEKIEYIKEDQKNEENINQIKNEKFEEKKNEKKNDFDLKDKIYFNSGKKILDIKTENILDLNENKEKNKIHNAIEVKKDNKNINKIKDLMKENKNVLNDSNKNKKINENKPNKKEINNNELNKNFHIKNNNKPKKNNIKYEINIDNKNDKINLNINEFKNNIDNKELLINNSKLDFIQNEINHDNKLNKELNINIDNINELTNCNYHFNKNTKKEVIEQKFNKNLQKNVNTNFKIINQDNNNDNFNNTIQNKNFKNSINNNINNKILNEKVSENYNINKINRDSKECKIENLKFSTHNTLDEEKHINHTLDINKKKYITKTRKIDKKTLNNNIYLSLEDNNDKNQMIYYQKIYKPINTEKLPSKKKKFITKKINQNINEVNNNNSGNIQSNLKNKINKDKNIHNQKFDDSIKEKIVQKLVDPSITTRNEMIRDRNIGYEQSWVNNTINNKISNSMYNNRLIENENNHYHKINNMNSTKKNIKLNNNAILFSEKKNEKKKNIQNINGKNQRIYYKNEYKIYSSIRDNHLYSNLFNNDDKANEIIHNQKMNQSMKNRKIYYIKNNINPKINNWDKINYSQRNKSIKISLQNDKILNNNKTFNQNISNYNIPNRYTSDNINNYQHSNTLSQNNEDLLEDINYRRKFVTGKYDFHSINTSKAQTNMKTLNLFDKRSLNTNKTSDKFNFYNENNFINNYTHKNNISNYNLLKGNSVHNQKLSFNMKLNSPETNVMDKNFINFNIDTERRKYNKTSNKDILRDRKLMKYTSNDIFNQNINLRLDKFSNSVENHKINKYSHPLKISNLFSNKNLYPTIKKYNNMKNSLVASRRANSTNNKYIYDNNVNPSRNNKNYSISEVKKINSIKYLNNKLIRKGISLSTINDSNMYNDNYNINTNNNIYNTKINQNLIYLSNYNLNDLLNNTNEIEYSQFNKTQMNPKNAYNIKNNKIYQKSREKIKRRNNLFLQENNRSTFQNNENNTLLNNYINIEIDKYNSKNPINIKNGSINNTKLRKKRRNENIENTNDDSENLLIRLINSKANKRQRTLGSENLNKKIIKK